jgi:hypothetical protein
MNQRRAGVSPVALVVCTVLAAAYMRCAAAFCTTRFQFAGKQHGPARDYRYKNQEFLRCAPAPRRTTSNLRFP